MSDLSPLSRRERLVVIDILRGFAMLGVLLGNLFHLFSGAFAEHMPPQSAADNVARWFVALCIQSKAQTLLTLLFGFGFAVQLIRARDRNEPVLGLYTRRMLVLFAFGMAHIALLWWGDVLWTYAIAGFGLLLFLRVSNRVRVAVGVCFIFVPSAIYWLPGIWEHVASIALDPSKIPAYHQELLRTIRGTEHVPVLKENLKFFLVFSSGSWPQYFPWLVGHFLLGYVVGTLRWFDRNGADHLPAFRKLLSAGLVIGAAGTGLTIALFAGAFEGYELSVPANLAGGALFEADYFGLAILFVATVVLLVQRSWWRRALSIVAPVGRMPLTTYITQSLICTFLIYGWGLGWIEWLSPAGYLGVGLAIFVVQIGVSHVWLRYFRFGPLEWLWRSLVYMRRQQMRV